MSHIDYRLRVDYRDLIKGKEYIILNAFYENTQEKYYNNLIYGTFNSFNKDNNQPWFYNLSNKSDNEWYNNYIYPTKYWHFYENIQDRIVRAVEKTSIIKEELIAVALQPHRVAKWFDNGNWGCIEI